MTYASGLYPGVVTHTRLKPRRHALRYNIFMLLLDLDEVETLDRSLRLFSLKRFNLTGFDPRRHDRIRSNDEFHGQRHRRRGHRAASPEQ